MLHKIFHVSLVRHKLPDFKLSLPPTVHHDVPPLHFYVFSAFPATKLLHSPAPGLKEAQQSVFVCGRRSRSEHPLVPFPDCPFAGNLFRRLPQLLCRDPFFLLQFPSLTCRRILIECEEVASPRDRENVAHLVRDECAEVDPVEAQHLTGAKVGAWQVCLDRHTLLLQNSRSQVDNE